MLAGAGESLGFSVETPLSTFISNVANMTVPSTLSQVCLDPCYGYARFLWYKRSLLRGSLRGRSIKQIQLHYPLMLCSCVGKSSSAFKGSHVAAGVCSGRTGGFKPVL